MRFKSVFLVACFYRQASVKFSSSQDAGNFGPGQEIDLLRKSISMRVREKHKNMKVINEISTYSGLGTRLCTSTKCSKNWQWKHKPTIAKPPCLCTLPAWNATFMFLSAWRPTISLLPKWCSRSLLSPYYSVINAIDPIAVFFGPCKTLSTVTCILLLAFCSWRSFAGAKAE